MALRSSLKLPPPLLILLLVLAADDAVEEEEAVVVAKVFPSPEASSRERGR
jgi:hypothetical protein